MWTARASVTGGRNQQSSRRDWLAICLQSIWAAKCNLSGSRRSSRWPKIQWNQTEAIGSYLQGMNEWRMVQAAMVNGRWREVYYNKLHKQGTNDFRMCQWDQLLYPLNDIPKQVTENMMENMAENKEQETTKNQRTSEQHGITQTNVNARNGKKRSEQSFMIWHDVAFGAKWNEEIYQLNWKNASMQMGIKDQEKWNVPSKTARMRILTDTWSWFHVTLRPSYRWHHMKNATGCNDDMEAYRVPL